MTSGNGIGDAMARSLVACLGTDCSAAAALAAAADLRRGGILDESNLRGVPLGSQRRAAADFERRGWLVNQGEAWHVPAFGMPDTAPAFLAGMAAMRGPAADEEAALTAVTLPPPPSAIAAALPATGHSYASLVSTEDAMAPVAAAALIRLTVMTPFLSKGGWISQSVYSSGRQPQREHSRCVGPAPHGRRCARSGIGSNPWG